MGDNPKRLKDAIAIASNRASILIFTGGLGPTPDDLTTETLGDFFQTPLVEKPEIIADITAKFARRGREMTPNNRKQALLPKGADILHNPTGTAPGIIWQPQGNLTIFTFPGVPSEMKRMWQETAIPYLKSQGWGKEIIYSRLLRFRGIGESTLATKVADLFSLTNPTVAPYASRGEVKLRISAKAESQDKALALITPVEEKIKEIAGLDCFGADEDTLASVVGKLLQKNGATVSVAESCTGGGLGAMFTSIAGSSDYFRGGVILLEKIQKQQEINSGFSCDEAIYISLLTAGLGASIGVAIMVIYCLNNKSASFGLNLQEQLFILTLVCIPILAHGSLLSKFIIFKPRRIKNLIAQYQAKEEQLIRP